MTRPYGDTAAGLAEHLGIPSVQVDYNRHLAEGYAEGPAATPLAARVVESAERAGFRVNAHHNRSDGGYNVFLLHPEGHELGVWLEKAIANLHNHDEANFELTFVPPANREGYAISREADQLTRAIHSAYFETASEAAREGRHEDAARLHDNAARGHYTQSLQLHLEKAHVKQHREAEGLHRIASDYHKERAGL
jgi:imidazolonepropionase-like amidohydrolase